MTFLPDAQIDVLLSSIQPKEATNTGYLMLPDTITEAAVKMSGHDAIDLYRRRAYPKAHVEITGAMFEYVNSNCAYVIKNAAEFRQNYYLELLKNGRLFLKYQSIIGSRHLADLSDEQTQALIALLVRQLGKPAATELTPQTTGQPSGVVADLEKLSVSGTRILLPEERLTSYPAIKRLLEKAGGKYSAKGYFQFEAGMDCETILSSLIGGDKVNLKKDFQFFATPTALGEQVIDACGPLTGKRVFEPHAGDGALADIAHQRGAEVVVNELWDVNVLKLKAKGYEPLNRDFLTLDPEETGLFDCVIANPPFTNNSDIGHVLHMRRFLKPGGVISAIMSTAWQTGTQKKHVAFREYLSEHDVDIEQVPAGTFSVSGTDVPTVRIRIRHLSPAPVTKATPQTEFAF